LQSQTTKTVNPRIKDGIYLNHIQLRNNAPIPFNWIIKDKEIKLDEYLKDLIFHQYFIYHDQYGIKRKVPPERITAFVINGQLYIYQGGSFNKSHFQGPICFYTAKIEIERNIPAHSSDPYYSSVSVSSTESYYEMEQFFFKIETGETVIATQQSFSELILDEPTISNAYKMLQNKQRRTLLFMYLRKYNEKHLIKNRQNYQSK